MLCFSCTSGAAFYMRNSVKVQYVTRTISISACDTPLHKFCDRTLPVRPVEGLVHGFELSCTGRVPKVLEVHGLQRGRCEEVVSHGGANSGLERSLRRQLEMNGHSRPFEKAGSE